MREAIWCYHPLRLPHHSLRLVHHSLRLPHHSLRLPHHSLRLPHHSLRLPHHSLRLPHHSLRLPHHPLRLPHHSRRLPHPDLIAHHYSTRWTSWHHHSCIICWKTVGHHSGIDSSVRSLWLGREAFVLLDLWLVWKWLAVIYNLNKIENWLYYYYYYAHFSAQVNTGTANALM